MSVILLGCLLFFLSWLSSFLARRAAAASCSLLGLFLLSKKSLVVVNELNETSLGVVTETVASLKDAGVSSWAVGDLLCYLIEEDANCVLVLQVAEHNTS